MPTALGDEKPTGARLDLDSIYVGTQSVPRLTASI